MKRHLTASEIDSILCDIPVSKLISPRIRDTVVKSINTSFRKQLSKIQIYPELLSQVKDFVLKKYETSLTPVGDMVGILAAQSMESFTQMTLNMFHSAGLSEKNVSLGLPRFEELMNATSNPKIVGFNFFCKTEFKTLEQLRATVLLPEVVLESFIDRSCIENKIEVFEDWYPIHDILFSDEYKKCDYRIRLIMNSDKIFRQSLNLLQIANRIESQLDNTIFTVCSPMNIEKLLIDVFVDTSEITAVNGKMSLQESHRVYVRDTVLKALKGLCISGTKGIEAVYPKEDKGCWYFEGNGGALIDLLSHPMCDSTSSINDNMWDIYECLGTEATRAFLVDEIIKVLSFDGSFVNPKHVMLLVDRMMIDGSISAVNRYGMDRAHFKPLAKAAFEESALNIFLSGMFGETDDIKSVSAALMTGKLASIGGTKVDILIDLAKLTSSTSSSTSGDGKVAVKEPEMIEF